MTPEERAEMDRNRQEIEALAWNLAGCSTFALGYGLDEPWDKAMARPALDDVYKLAMRYRTAEAQLKSADALAKAVKKVVYTNSVAEALAAYEKVRGK